MDATYWSNNGLYQTAADALHERVPTSGSVKAPRKNRELERFRKASNAYYDLYNNGLWNCKRSFAKLFGIRPADYTQNWRGVGFYSDRMYVLTEQVMNGIIEAAAAEQGIPLEVNPAHNPVFMD